MSTFEPDCETYAESFSMRVRSSLSRGGGMMACARRPDAGGVLIRTAFGLCRTVVNYPLVICGVSRFDPDAHPCGPSACRGLPLARLPRGAGVWRLCGGCLAGVTLLGARWSPS